MNRRALILAPLSVLAATALTRPGHAQPGRAARYRQASAKPARRRRGGLTASHVRTRVVTRTFSSTGPIEIPRVGASSNFGPASPYPSIIRVSGFNQGRILEVRIILHDLTHTAPTDIDVLLVAPGNVGVVIMSDASVAFDNAAIIDITLVFDQDAAGALPTFLVSGVFQPSNFGQEVDRFDPPAPQGVTGHSLTRFHNRNPNGAWQLFVSDDSVAPDVGTLGGWSLQIRARVRVPHQHRRNGRLRRRARRPKRSS